MDITITSSAALDHDERARIVESLGGGNILVLRNHGLLTVGETIGEAFFWMYCMEAACQYQVDMLSQNRELQPPSKEVQDYTIALGKKLFGKGGSAAKNMQWPAMIRNWSVRASTTGANKADRAKILPHAARCWSGRHPRRHKPVRRPGWRRRRGQSTRSCVLK